MLCVSFWIMYYHVIQIYVNLIGIKLKFIVVSISMLSLQIFLNIFHVVPYCLYFLISEGSTHNNSICRSADNFLAILE